MKLQPNFSWQKYQTEPEDEREQFQHQLQSEHIQVANAVNATIDDESFFSRERMTSFTWLDGRPIWRKTISGVIVGTAITAYPHGIIGLRTLVRLEGTAQDATPMAVFGISLPYVDPNTRLNSIGYYIDPVNLNIDAGNGFWAGYFFNVTIYYTKS